MKHKLFVLDMDGTFYLGDDLFPGSLPFLDAVKRAGCDHLFLTNNSSKTSDQYVEKLQRLGVDAQPGDVLTSGDATIELLRKEGRWKRLYLVATRAVERQFEAAGFELTADSPDAVVLTYDTTIDYEKLTTFCLLVREGRPYVATHPDFNCPSPAGPLPDIGAFMALVEASAERRPDMIVGKPMPGILEAAMIRKGATKEQTMMIGDRLYTDVECGLATGATAALVLTGETTREMLAASDTKPDLVLESLADLTTILRG